MMDLRGIGVLLNNLYASEYNHPAEIEGLRKFINDSITDIKIDAHGREMLQIQTDIDSKYCELRKCCDAETLKLYEEFSHIKNAEARRLMKSDTEVEWTEAEVETKMSEEMLQRCKVLSEKIGDLKK